MAHALGLSMAYRHHGDARPCGGGEGATKSAMIKAQFKINVANPHEWRRGWVKYRFRLATSDVHSQEPNRYHPVAAMIAPFK